MPRITMELLRKRSEHNEGEISSLEEISLHQENIERIELLNHACRDLRILLLQYNLISKIENLQKLKRLEYLNLAINNIEVIENLEGLESLRKLDLTVNFIGDLRDVKRLRNNEHLEQLYLTGNPCCDYEGYRDYVLAVLPQLSELDSEAIGRAERIRALQSLAGNEGEVTRAYRKYLEVREAQKIRFRESQQQQQRQHSQFSSSIKITELTEDEKSNDADTQRDKQTEEEREEEEEDSGKEDEKFWSAVSYHTPEDRVAIANKTMEQLKKKERNQENDKQRKLAYVPKFFSPEGRPYNVNQPKIKFRLNDEEDRENVILEVSLYKYLDSSLVDVDVQPEYVRVKIKGKVLQLVLACEVAADRSTAQRNSSTGALLVKMPRIKKLDKLLLLCPPALERPEKGRGKPKCGPSLRAMPALTKREHLEIGPPKDRFSDLLKIVEKSKTNAAATTFLTSKLAEKEDFLDDPNVPPLE